MKTDTAPVTGKTTGRPTSAGKWIYTGITIVHTDEAVSQSEDGPIKWKFQWFERDFPRVVTVTENPTSGRLCRELRMGGSTHCGFQPWSGIWRKAA